MGGCFDLCIRDLVGDHRRGIPHRAVYPSSGSHPSCVVDLGHRCHAGGETGFDLGHPFWRGCERGKESVGAR